MGRGPSSKVVHETSGAVTIRMLRERARLSQGEVEVEAELGENYLNRIERGLIARPKRVTLERILDALQATYDDRRHVLESYGYVVTNPLPSTTEIVSAQVAFNQIAVDLMVPAQLLDCAQRMQASNRLLELTIGHAPGSTASRRLVGRSIFEITFDPQHRVRQRILNLSTWGRHMLPVLMYELRTYGLTA